MKHLLWAAVPAVLAWLRFSEALSQGSWAAAVTGVGFVLLAVAWYIRPPFTKSDVLLPEKLRTPYTVAHGVGLALLVLGLLWRLGG